jgi:hypothetical protein
MTDPSILLYYNKSYFAKPVWSPIPTNCKCEITDDKKRLLDVKGVVFHVPSMWESDRAELHRLHQLKPPHQIWVAWSQESDANYPALKDPAFMGLFDYEMTYRQASDIWVPYLNIELQSALEASRPKRKSKMCAAFISSGLDESGRKQIFDDLVKHMPIDSFGRFKKNRRLLFDRGPKTKLKVLKRYRFTLAFENSLCQDYVTEKFFEPLIAGSIPVYLGAPNVDEFAPGDRSYINVNDFASMKDLAQFLDSVDDSEYHVWRDRPLRTEFTDKVVRTLGEPFDSVCDLVSRAAPQI